MERSTPDDEWPGAALGLIGRPSFVEQPASQLAHMRPPPPPTPTPIAVTLDNAATGARPDLSTVLGDNDCAAMILTNPPPQARRRALSVSPCR
jgi:hypothetical protein